MARIDVWRCDECGKQADACATGPNAVDYPPEGWITLSWDVVRGYVPMTDEVRHLCSWACVTRYAGARKGEQEQADG